MTLANDQPALADCHDCAWTQTCDTVLAADDAAGAHEDRHAHLTAVRLLGGDR